MSGDDFQLLMTLKEVLIALRPGSDVATIEVEAADAESVDDIVVRYRDGRVRFVQVKHTVDATSPVGSEWLMKARGKGRSVLQKLFDSWGTLRGDGYEIELITDRDIDPADPVMLLFDRGTQALWPEVSAERLPRKTSDAREAWAKHVGAPVEDLVAMLKALRICTGRALANELDHVRTLMQLNGLADDQGALDSAMALMREWVQLRGREFSTDELREQMTSRVPARSSPWSLVVVDAIAPTSPTSTEAARLDFLDLYEGSDPFAERRALLDPAAGDDVIVPAFADAREQLTSSGVSHVLVRGAMRLSLWFLAGAAFRMVQGFTVATDRNGDVWSSAEALGVRPGPTVARHRVGRGSELAVAVGVALDPTVGALAFVEAGDLPVSELVVLSPAGGASNQAVRDAVDAVSLAEALRDAIRALRAELHAEHLHLFLAVPAGVALLLGNRWNLLGPTTVYEHTADSRGYQRVAMIQA